MEVLRMMGLTIDLTQDQAEQYCLGIIEGKTSSATDVSFWISKSVQEYSDLL
jgi:hypothetical protein